MDGINGRHNSLLDDLDKELERRGHAFVRYADDCNIHVRSRRAGERVMASITRFLAERLRLAVNAAKSAVDRPWRRSFLGFTMTAHRVPRLRVAPTSVARFKSKLRALWRQGRGRSLGRIIEDLPRSSPAGSPTSGWPRSRASSRRWTAGSGGVCAA